MSAMVKISGEIKNIYEWARLYNIPLRIIRERYYSGCVGEELIAPLYSDMLDDQTIHNLWGGTWEYKG